MRLLINLFQLTVFAAAFALASPALASPVDFGMAELNAAIAARNFKYAPKIQAELDIQAPETFRIEPYAAGGGHITGGDLRGLMYGLLEAAEQMRATGRLKQTHGAPTLALRGIRVAAEPEASWFTSGEFWQRYFAGMARDRFNRLEVTFHSVPGPDAIPALRSIAQAAMQYGVDLAIGLDATNPILIQQLLAVCPSVRTIVLHREAFRGDAMLDAMALFRVLHDAGRRVVLELPNSDSTAGLVEEASNDGAPFRLFSRFTGVASNPQPRDWYWEVDPTQDADAVNAISGAGFEITAPLVRPLNGEQREPELDSIADWGRAGYNRPLPHEAPPAPAPK